MTRIYDKIEEAYKRRTKPMEFDNIITDGRGVLVNFENYGPYKYFVENENQIVNVTKDITKDTWKDHYIGIYNILRDGIETELVHSKFITLKFTNKKVPVVVDLSVSDYWINLIMWYLPLQTEPFIRPEHIIFEKEFKQNSIKKYIDKFFIEPNRKLLSNRTLNNLIDDMMQHFAVVNEFTYYFANTINLEDSIFMMREIPEFNDILHIDLSGIPLEDTKTEGMKASNRLIELMKTKSKEVLGYDHCLTDAWRASEGVNPKQFKEFSVNIGSKPDGQGGVFPIIINKSFINGGLQDPVDYCIESSAGRTAQILSKMNVGNSGKFARQLGLNNTNSRLHRDHTYCCDTKNFIMYTVKDEKFLNKIDNRYYKFSPNGLEFLLKADRDKHLIGKTIYMRSPMTCASASRGDGICYRCYGDLAYTVKDINVGKIASEILSSVLTQILLSAKHLLETRVEKIMWTSKFYELFEIDGNAISLIDEIDDIKELQMIIDPEDIELENDSDSDGGDDDDEGSSYFSTEYNEYLTKFDILDVNSGEIHSIYNDKSEKLYISSELNEVIRKKSKAMEDKVIINLNDLKDIQLFLLHIQNNDLTKTLNQLTKLLNKASSVESITKDAWAQDVVDTAIAGDLSITAIHLELIMSNQIRSADNILEAPDWSYADEPYTILTLNKALTANPSVTISLSFQNISKLLYNPLTFKKNGTSFMDLFFQENPQEYIRNIKNYKPVKFNDNGLIDPMSFDEAGTTDRSATSVDLDIDEDET